MTVMGVPDCWRVLEGPIAVYFKHVKLYFRGPRAKPFFICRSNVLILGDVTNPEMRCVMSVEREIRGLSILREILKSWFQEALGRACPLWSCCWNAYKTLGRRERGFFVSLPARVPTFLWPLAMARFEISNVMYPAMANHQQTFESQCSSGPWWRTERSSFLIFMLEGLKPPSQNSWTIDRRIHS